MEKNMSWLIGLVIISALISLVGLLVIGGNQVDEEALKDSITTQMNADLDAKLDEKFAEFPKPATAEEIAKLIPKVEVPKWDVPEFKSDAKVSDLWEDMYSDEIDELEAEAYDVAEYELEDHDYKLLTKWLEASMSEFYELDDVDVEDYEINIIGLGLEEDEDKSAEVVFELEVYYSLEEGSVNDLEVLKLVTATAYVSFDEGDYSDEDVDLIFA